MLNKRLGDPDGALARGRQLIELGASTKMVESYFKNTGHLDEYNALHPANPGDGPPADGTQGDGARR
jgi:hypothetical protein